MSVVSEEKQRSERSQTFHFNNSEVKRRSERSQRFHFQSLMPKKLFFSGLYYNSNSERNMISQSCSSQLKQRINPRAKFYFSVTYVKTRW